MAVNCLQDLLEGLDSPVQKDFKVSREQLDQLASLVHRGSKEQGELQAMLVISGLLVTQALLDRLVSREPREIREYKVHRVLLA